MRNIAYNQNINSEYKSYSYDNAISIPENDQNEQKQNIGTAKVS